MTGLPTPQPWLKGQYLKQICCFESSWLLFMVSFIPMKVNKFRIPNTKHFIKGAKCETFKGVNVVVY